MSNVAAVSAEKGHPPGLWILFFAELWERFCYYGMRALLAVYVADLFFVQQSEASLVYGAYTSLIYATGIFGGAIADRLLGFRRSILLGGFVMALGCFALSVRNQDSFLVGLSLLIVGNGLFKPNISSLVGKLYQPGDPRRDAGFTIFYMGINLGALLAPLACAAVSRLFPKQVPLDQLPPGLDKDVAYPQWQQQGFAELPDYRWGFLLAGIGMLLGIVTFWRGRARLGDQGLPPQGREGGTPLLLVVLGCAALTPLVYLLIANKEFAFYILMALAVGMTIYLIAFAVQCFGAGDKVGGQRIFALIALLLANTVFWSAFEQAGNSLNFFARDYVHMISLPGGKNFDFEWFQSVNSLFIIALGPVFAWTWVWLDQRRRNPSIPVKFGIGVVCVGLGFGVLMWAMSSVGMEGRVSFWSLVALYFVHTCGELCISPVGLSMVTKLAPARMTGLVMGAWFLSISCANFLAGKISEYAATVDESKAEVAGGVPMSSYYPAYEFLLWYTVIAGGIFLLISKPLNKWMHGIK
ncbi:MAG: peptide MFS transporter [Planctomycetes bacterium]|nr:peptide MFS transporter [Planctomycetota bacterium]